MSSHVDVTFEVDVPEVDSADIERAVLTTLREEGAALELSVVVMDDEAIHEVNRRFLEHDYPTDVITFDLRGDEPGVDGEIYVSWTTAVREAGSRGLEPAGELLLYCIHGTLHLLDYDDHEPEERRRMHARQEALLAGLGFGTEAS